MGNMYMRRSSISLIIPDINIINTWIGRTCVFVFIIDMCHFYNHIITRHITYFVKPFKIHSRLHNFIALWNVTCSYCSVELTFLKASNFL